MHKSKNGTGLFAPTPPQGWAQTFSGVSAAIPFAGNRRLISSPMSPPKDALMYETRRTITIGQHLSKRLIVRPELCKFDIMQAQIEIGYDQLVKLVKQLPKKQWTLLKNEVEENGSTSDTQFDMLTFLLNGPTFSKKQLDGIARARKEINQWRTNKSCGHIRPD